jgi:mono/diheme cytochrome c family protein/heme/copper-type cytochrome/quinol oxidase subunit 4
MAKDNHKGGIGFYVFVGLVLAVITYVEFAIVEYDVSWLNRGWSFALLAILSLIKFFMVIWFFMHLKDDNKTYTGFFSSGMVIAMGTFIALAALFTVRSAMNVRAQPEEVAVHSEAEAGHAGVDIPERAFTDTLRVPQPKNQGLSVEVPRAADNTFSLNGIPAFGLVNDTNSSNETTPANESAEPETTPEPETTEPESTAPAEESEAGSSSEESSSVEASTENATEDVAATTEDSSTESNATEATTSTTTLSAQTEVDWDKELGEKTYNNCVACHQPNGQGVPSAFPPQAGHAAEIYNVEGGRTYMIHTVLWGLQGEIKVDGKTYNGIMTPWGSLLKDEQIAAVLNHVLTSWGNDALLEDFTPITAEEVALERANSMTAQEVYESRAALNIPE